MHILDTDKLTKTQLLTYTATQAAVVPVINFLPTATLSPAHANYIANKCKQEGKVYNQLRIGYIYWMHKNGEINLTLAEFFNITAASATAYVAENLGIARLLTTFSPAVLAQFNTLATDVYRTALAAATTYAAANPTLLHKLRTWTTRPTLLLLQEHKDLTALNIVQEYTVVENINLAEHSLQQLSKRATPADILLRTTFRATDAAPKATDAAAPKATRVLKAKLPSLGLSKTVLGMFVTIHNELYHQNGLTPAAYMVAVKEQIITAYLSGMLQATIAKTLRVSLRTVSRTLAAYKVTGGVAPIILPTLAPVSVIEPTKVAVLPVVKVMTTVAKNRASEKTKTVTLTTGGTVKILAELQKAIHLPREFT